MANKASDADHLRTKDWLVPPVKYGEFWFCPDAFADYLTRNPWDGNPVKPPKPVSFAEWKRVRRAGFGDFTYFAKGRESGRIKIGRSRDPYVRIASLLWANEGERADELVIVPDGGLERCYHNLFTFWHIGSEWFAPHPIILHEVERLKREQSVEARPEYWNVF